MQGHQVLKEECLTYIGDPPDWKCVKLIRLKEAGGYLTVELMKRKHDEDYWKITTLADLPRETYGVDDPYFGGYFIAYEDGKLIAVSRNWTSFLYKLRNLGYPISYSTYLSGAAVLSPRFIRKTISAGLSDSGDVVDPFGVLDATDYGIEPLKAAYAWVRSMYEGRNAALAWFNVVAVVAQVAASPLKGMYYDYVICNSGTSGLNMAQYVLEPMLGGWQASATYGTVIYSVPPPLLAKKVKRLAAQLLAQLLELNRLPMVLAGQTEKTLEIYGDLLKSAADGFLVLPGRRGTSTRIPNLRGLIIFTDATAAAEYCIDLKWDPAQIRPPPPTGLPAVKPIYGFAARLWRKYRGRFDDSRDLFEIIRITAEAIAQESRGKAEEVAAFTEHAVEDALKAAFIE